MIGQFALSATLIVGAALVPAAEARDCYYDLYGNYRCNNLSTGARVGIGIAVFVLGLFLICLFGWMRRRRIQRVNKSFIPQQGVPPSGPYQPGPGYGGPGYAGSPQTQYPPQTYQQQYAPPTGPPPQGFAPPGPPPYPGNKPQTEPMNV